MVPLRQRQAEMVNLVVPSRQAAVAQRLGDVHLRVTASSPAEAR